jgi:hypothetical protein
VKIGCHCGSTIVDQTDDLPYKGHLVPDQEWYDNFDRIDNLFESIIDGRMDRKEANRKVSRLFSEAVRLMWQCRECGRLYIDAPDGELRCFIPESMPADHEILRSRPNAN